MIINFPKLGQTEGGGGGDTPTGDASLAVRFLDYDGTVVYSYTKEDFASLSALPANPSHDGLTAQGWNWSLADAQAYVAKYGMLDIGQMYITDDGKTRLYVSINSLARPTVELHFYQSVANALSVNWGDGSPLESVADTGDNKSMSHTYAAAGDYVITLSKASGTVRLGYNSSYGVMGAVNTSSRRYWTQSFLTRVEFGEGIGVNSYAFQYCSNLRAVTLPENFTFGTYTYIFQYCHSLRWAAIPKGITALPNYTFYSCEAMFGCSLPQGMTSLGDNSFSACYSLSRLSVPQGVTSIGGSIFNFDGAMKEIAFPDSVTTIGSNVFTYAQGIKSYYFYSTIPPTLSGFGSNIAADRVIYVPAESVEAYKGATNWTGQANYIQPIPES